MTKIVAIGAGRMGRGIAQVFASAGYRVAIVDLKPRPAGEAQTLLAEAKDEVVRNLDFLTSLGLLDQARAAAIAERIELVDVAGAPRALAGAEFIFEGVPEVLAAKRDALERLSEMAPPGAVIASTTSTISVEKLSKFVAAPARFLNAHWLNPAYLIPLVEVSPGATTDEGAVDKLMALLRRVGKEPVRCKASPGYIVPRIQAVAMNEAARMVEEGVATAEDIDTAIRAGFGIRYATMGLVEFIDWGGVDILYYASRHLKEELKSERFQSPEIVDRMMARGDMGLKSGKGFYDYSTLDPDDWRRRKLTAFVALLDHLKMLPMLADGDRDD
jgi:3-hydroxybutyryl-CoA dehydrogenase